MLISRFLPDRRRGCEQAQITVLGSWACRCLALAGLFSGSVAASIPGFAQQGNPDDQQFRQIFLSNGFTYCDARKLSKALQVAPWQAKVSGGKKIAQGRTALLFRQMVKGTRIFRRNRQSCATRSLYDSPTRFIYEDAQRLAEAWQAKAPRS